MHFSSKPVRKCHGCGLNLTDHCGVFEDPREVWQRHKVCPGYKSEKLLAEYEAAQAKSAADPHHKLKRKEAMAKRRKTRHVNGDQHVLIAAVRK